MTKERRSRETQGTCLLQWARSSTVTEWRECTRSISIPTSIGTDSFILTSITSRCVIVALLICSRRSVCRCNATAAHSLGPNFSHLGTFVPDRVLEDEVDAFELFAADLAGSDLLGPGLSSNWGGIGRSSALASMAGSSGACTLTSATAGCQKRVHPRRKRVAYDSARRSRI